MSCVILQTAYMCACMCACMRACMRVGNNNVFHLFFLVAPLKGVGIVHILLHRPNCYPFLLISLLMQSFRLSCGISPFLTASLFHRLCFHWLSALFHPHHVTVWLNCIHISCPGHLLSLFTLCVPVILRTSCSHKREVCVVVALSVPTFHTYVLAIHTLS